MVGGSDYEGEMAAARLRLQMEQSLRPADAQRLREAEAREQLAGRLLVFALAAVIYGLLVIFG